MAKVITCPGALSTYNQNNFGGTLFQSPNTVISAPSGGWDNFSGINNTGATNDMNKMYDLIIAHKDTVDWLVVAGHSRGGQIIYKLFRERMADLVANVNPAKILFISSGNPETRWTGLCYTDYDNNPPVYPGDQPYGNGYGLLDSGPFRLLNIVRLYDEWADTPEDLENEDAQQAMDDANNHSAYDGAPHLDVNGWPVDWNEWTRYDVGNISYLTEKPALSITPPVKTPLHVFHTGKAALNWKTKTELLDNANRQDIESAYTNRPTPLVGLVTI